MVIHYLYKGNKEFSYTHHAKISRSLLIYYLCQDIKESSHTLLITYTSRICSCTSQSNSLLRTTYKVVWSYGKYVFILSFRYQVYTTQSNHKEICTSNVCCQGLSSSQSRPTSTYHHVLLGLWGFFNNCPNQISSYALATTHSARQSTDIY